MTKAAKVKIRVSTQPVVVMEAEVARQIRQHSRTSMKAEVCGVLIGSTEHERMMVEACIPGNNAAQGGAHVTFTQDTWEHIYKIKDKEYPEQKIVGWYHSHPGFGVFLSEHDLFIQQNFFSNPQQVAWVYDPHTDEEGCFGWIGSSIEKLTAIRVGYTQNVEITANASSDYEEGEDSPSRPPIRSQGERESREPAWMRWTSMALGYFAAVVLGVALGYVFRDWQIAPTLGTCQQIVQHPVEACQQIFQHYLPQSLGPAVPPASPGVQGTPGPVPGNPRQSLPQQEQAPAQKGNNAKH
jgi:proteasome lid subunit RPN8/RPN11